MFLSWGLTRPKQVPACGSSAQCCHRFFIFFQLAYANCARAHTLAKANTRRPVCERAEPHFAPARLLPICKNFAHTSDLSCARPKSQNTRAPLGRPFGYKPHMRLICSQKHPLGCPAGNKKFFFDMLGHFVEIHKKICYNIKKTHFYRTPN